MGHILVALLFTGLLTLGAMLIEQTVRESREEILRALFGPLAARGAQASGVAGVARRRLTRA